jgi:hypothetical protein
VGADGVESRLPVHRLAEDYPDVFNMYILALEEMQKKNESDELRLVSLIR